MPYVKTFLVVEYLKLTLQSVKICKYIGNHCFKRLFNTPPFSSGHWICICKSSFWMVKYCILSCWTVIHYYLLMYIGLKWRSLETEKRQQRKSTIRKSQMFFSMPKICIVCLLLDWCLASLPSYTSLKIWVINSLFY